MKNVVAALGIVFSASALNIHAEVPQQLQQRFSAPGPAGKVTVQISGECRGKLIYEVTDFTAESYAHPSSSGHSMFNAKISDNMSVHAYFYNYSPTDIQNYTINKAKLNFEARTKNPYSGTMQFYVPDEDLKNIRCKNGQDLQTFLTENNGHIQSMPTENTKLNQSLKITGKEAPYNYRAISKQKNVAHFSPMCQINGDLTGGLQSNFYDAKCNQKTRITIKTNINLKGRATPLEM